MAICLDDLRPEEVVGALPPAPYGRLSLRQARRLLCAALPLPTLDAAAVLDLLAYQQRHNTAAYCSHHRRRLQLLLATGPPQLSL